MERIDYTIRVDIDEHDHRLELLHENIRKYDAVLNTVSAGCDLKGQLLRGKLE